MCLDQGYQAPRWRFGEGEMRGVFPELEGCPDTAGNLCWRPYQGEVVYLAGSSEMAIASVYVTSTISPFFSSFR